MTLEVINYENVSEWPIAEDNVLGEKLELMEGEQMSIYHFQGQQKYVKIIGPFSDGALNGKIRIFRNIFYLLMKVFFSAELLRNIIFSADLYRNIFSAGLLRNIFSGD